MRTKSYNKKKMLGLLLMPVLAYSVSTMAYTPSAEAACPGTIDGISTTACNLTGVDMLTVANTGSLDLRGNSSTAVTVDASATGVTIDNSGKIIADDGYNAIYVDSAATGTKIINKAGALISAPTSSTIYFDGALDGSLDNAGTISAGGEQTVDYATAIYISNDLSGSLTNQSSGVISATATSSYDVTAIGVEIDGDLSGTLTNHGRITASGSNTGTSSYDAWVTGVYISNNLTGTLTNTGLISATARDLNSTGTYANATAYGIYMGDLASTGTLTNSSTGVIEAVAAVKGGTYSYTAEAFAYAIDMGAINGTLTNDGTIKATATATQTGTSTAEVSAAGIYMGDLSGTLTNNGDIKATATTTATANQGSSSYVYATAYGISMDALSGTLTNSSTGTISATAEAKATGTWAGAYAYGLETDTIESTGKLDNSGTIKATATAISTATSSASYPYVSASAYGVYGSSIDAGGSLTNSGIISAMATANANNTEMTSAYAYAVGLYTNSIDGTLTNTSTGTISAKAIAANQGSDADATAYGAYIGGSVTGTFNNEGTIEAIADAGAATTASDYAYGVYISGGLNSTLTNSGTISGIATSMPEEGYSLYINSGTGTVDNMTGGLLSGNLYIGGSVQVNNSGTIDIPYAANTAMSSEASIAGDFNQSASGVLSFDGMSATEYAQLNVGGTATFAEGSGVMVNAVDGHTITGGDQLLDVVTAGTLSATSFNVTDNIGLIDFTAAIDGNTVDLTAEKLSAADMVIANGNTSALGVAETIDNFLANGAPAAMDPVLNSLWNLNTEQEVTSAMDQLIPTLAGDASRTTLTLLTDTGRILGARQASNQGMNSGDQIFSDRNLWVAPFGSWADQDKNNGAYGFEADTQGIMIGVDGEIDGPFSLGAAFAYGSTDIDGDNNATSYDGDISSNLFMLYGSYHLDDRTDLDMYATYGIHDNDLRRNIPFMGSTAKSTYDSWSTSIGAKLGRDYAINERTVLTPSAQVTYAYVDDDSYTEKQAGSANLKVDGNDVDELILGVDGKITHDVDGLVSLTANLGVGYDALADEGSINSAFVGAPGASFKTKGVEPDEWIGTVGAGIIMGKDDKLQTTLRYDADIRDDFDNQTVSVKVNIPF